jgi:catechol 2,3-dioxygenase-like lactoylglutathione lyase family enzyme
MQLNHIDLAVPDVALTSGFFKTVFGFVEIETKGNAGMTILNGSDGFELILTRAHASNTPLYPKTFHIGFLVSSEQEVQDTYCRLRATGVELPAPPRSVRGHLMFYCRAPGGILVEVSHRPTARPIRPPQGGDP